MDLTARAFDKLLASFSSNRDEAASQYEEVRLKLIRFFEWRCVESADALADETLDRVARRVDEGVEIGNVRSYSYGVARLVAMETRPKAEPIPIEELPERLRRQVEIESESEPRLECLDQCLEVLPSDNRQLIMDYYQEERRAKIELRQQLAHDLDIPLNALRIRAHRIRSSLEKCIMQCLGASSNTK